MYSFSSYECGYVYHSCCHIENKTVVKILKFLFLMNYSYGSSKRRNSILLKNIIIIAKLMIHYVIKTRHMIFNVSINICG